MSSSGATPVRTPAINAAYESLTCPLPACGQYLYLTFEHSADLYQGTLDDREPIKPGDGDVSTWKVECVHGHVILVPTEPGCSCDDDCSCDVDPSEEVRTFRASDVDRLRLVLDQLARVTRPDSAGGAR
jgi:hypothetical protein